MTDFAFLLESNVGHHTLLDIMMMFSDAWPDYDGFYWPHHHNHHLFFSRLQSGRGRLAGFVGMPLPPNSVALVARGQTLRHLEYVVSRAAALAGAANEW